jgi:hypothetical protein
MARIDWTVLCDHALFDREDRLSIIGVIRALSTPTLPITLHQAVLVARLADIQSVDEVAVSVGLVTPTGQRRARTGSESVTIELVREYAVAILRDIPLSEEGIHRFQVQLRGQPVVSLDVPVFSSAPSTLGQVQ